MYTAYLPFFRFFQHFDAKMPDLITRSTPRLDVFSFVEISTLEMRTSNASKLALIRVMGGFSRVSFRPSQLILKYALTVKNPRNEVGQYFKGILTIPKLVKTADFFPRVRSRLKTFGRLSSILAAKSGKSRPHRNERAFKEERKTEGGKTKVFGGRKKISLGLYCFR